MLDERCKPNPIPCCERHSRFSTHTHTRVIATKSPHTRGRKVLASHTHGLVLALALALSLAYMHTQGGHTSHTESA